MVRLLLTHGRGLAGRDKARLRAKFTRYLQEGLERAGYRELDDDEIDFLYYGDFLDRAEREVGDQVMAPVLAAEREAGSSCEICPFADELDALQERLHAAGEADQAVATMVEERADRDPTVGDDTDEAARRQAMDAAIDARTDQLLDNPAELLDVLEREFGPTYADDDAVKTGIASLEERLDHPREAAARKAAEDEQTEDPGRIETLLREWIVDPATDTIAGLRAIRRLIEEYGVDLRQRLGDWRTATWSQLLTRFEQTDFGQQWALLFDVLALVASKTMLDSFYIARRMVDVDQFLRDDDIRKEIRGYFRDALDGRDVPTILIAHSLGTVVAYDALREFPGLFVPGMVTMGSPLSIGHFRRSLARDGESGDRLPVPGMLDRWVNVYSELDPLVLGSGIESYFEGGGDESGRGPIDREAENHGYLDAHSPDQYLRSRATSTAIIRMIAHARVLTPAG
jgi:pimeloyl-ACP methyl ester carboxylesterase